MKSAVLVESKRNDAVVMAAAVADYKPVQSLKSKIKKHNLKYKIELQKTEDILGILGKNKGKKILIGFALETDNLIPNAKKKLSEKNLDMIVANDESAFDGDSSKVSLIYSNGNIDKLGMANKASTAGKILDLIASKGIKQVPTEKTKTPEKYSDLAMN
jgi:phosphopantothenoylcysteine decarboxylase/phosphopantothenate--cysteine ligase